MNSNRILIISLCFISLLVITVTIFRCSNRREVKKESQESAEQNKVEHPQWTVNFVNEITTLLSLTADQITEIYTIEEEISKISSKRTRDMNDKGVEDINTRMSEIIECNLLREEKYKTALTVEQFKKFQEYNAQLIEMTKKAISDITSQEKK